MTRVACSLAVFLICTAGHAQVRKDDGHVLFRYPGHTWVMTLKLDGFEITQTEANKQEGMYVLAHNTQSRVIVSVTMEEAREPGDSKACRAYYLPSKVNPNDETAFKTLEIGQIAALEYVYKFEPGGPFGAQQKHFNGYIARNGVWIDIHISKNDYTEEQRPLLVAVLESVDFPRSMELYLEAQRHLHEKEDALALRCMTTALAMEKKDAKFSQRMLRDLITDLAVAYGMSGDLDKAKETLDYGLERDPTYPLYLYNMACVYAERNDLDNAMANLRRAFENKDKVNPDRTLPDPRTDSSFQRFLGEERFKKLLGELGL